MKRKNTFLLLLFFGLLVAGALPWWQVTRTQERTPVQTDKSPPTEQSVEVCPTNNDEPKIVVRNVGEPGGFEVENKGEETELDWRVLVETKKGDKWERLANSRTFLNILLVEDCGLSPITKSVVKNEDNKPLCRKFAADETVRAKPWYGWSCSAQCLPKSCRGNAYMGPGIFRFVVRSCDGQKDYYGEEFKLPPYDPKKSPLQ